jgi:N-acetylmuramoyl-L-alanine amidase-like protein
VDSPTHEPGCTCCAPTRSFSRRSLLVKGAVAGAALAAFPALESRWRHGPHVRGEAASLFPLARPAHGATVRAPRTHVPAPGIMSRRQWGANEALRNGTPAYEHHIEKIVVHHTGTPNGLPDWSAQVRQIYEFETSHGYQDIAYHFLIDPHGVIYEGRWARDLSPGRMPDGTDGHGNFVVGGHAINHNERTLGVALLGDYTVVAPTPAMLSSTVALLAWLCGRTGVDPLGVSTYVASSGAREPLPDICPHGSTTITFCPGTHVLKALPAVRQRAAERLGAPGGAEGSYWIATADGQQIPFGGAGDPVHTVYAPAWLAGIALHPGGRGYWTFGPDGGVFAHSGAPFHGSLGGRRLGSPIVGLAPTQTGNGYWLASSDGGVFAFGDAHFHGSLAGKRLRTSFVDITRSPSGGGYWLAAADGGVFAFGDARFHGSVRRAHLRAPISAMAASGNGYWLAATDGGVFALGDAHSAGSAAHVNLPAAVVGMVPTTSHRGYALLTSDGSVMPFGDAPFLGNAQGLVTEAVGIAGTLAPRKTRV